MDPLTVVSVVQTCYTLGSQMVTICMTWKNADKEVEQRVVVVESCWARTKHQVDFMTRITAIIDADLGRIMHDLLGQLSSKLSHAITNLEAVIRSDHPARSSVLSFGSKAKKGAWVWKKRAIDAIITELETWQRRFDPSWFLLMKIASPVIDSELAKAKAVEVRLRGPATVAGAPFTLAAGIRNVLSPSNEQLRSLVLPEAPMEWIAIPYSEARAARRESGSDMRWYIIDTVQVGPAVRVRDVMQDVRVLAAKLSQADPLAFGLLNCKGVMAISRRQLSPGPPRDLEPAAAPGFPVRAPSPYLGLPNLPPTRSPSPSQRDYSAFQFVFRIPEGMDALQSLRQLLLIPGVEISLSRKIRIARELAKAVNYVHVFAFVHKNIRPESVLCFEDEKNLSSRAFLVGFDAFRGADAGTMMAGDISWERNIYRHPLRQGGSPTERYRMLHDIYSLGVCLLEIGLWESFVDYTNESEVAGRPLTKFGKTYYDFQSWLKDRQEPCGAYRRPATFNTLAFKLKDYLVEQARTRLAPRVGDRYVAIVISCLTCLDDDNEDFGGLEDVSDHSVAVQFIQSIMKDLEQISV